MNILASRLWKVISHGLKIAYRTYYYYAAPHHQQQHHNPCDLQTFTCLMLGVKIMSTAQHVWYVKYIGNTDWQLHSELHMFCLPGRLTRRVGGGATEESNRWKSANLPEPPAETNGWERGRLQGSSTWHTLFQGHSWAVDLATGVSGEPHQNSRGSPVDQTAEELEPGECRWDEFNKIWCNLAQRFAARLLTGTWDMIYVFEIHVLKWFWVYIYNLNIDPVVQDCSGYTSDRLLEARTSCPWIVQTCDLATGF